MNHARVPLPPDFRETNRPLVFLAGPIQGAPDWHREATEHIHRLNADQWVASPKRFEWNDRLDYNTQVDWETRHLNQAAYGGGVILFWLALEAQHFCERPYAQTSRFELGEWKVKHERDGIHLVVGIADGFTNQRYIQRRLSQDCRSVPIFNTLEETCAQAVKMIAA